ncbi:hypothetical protein KJJ36_13840 [Staphylococcus pseudoxylosus]|uniref:hypothetical protein n=1 Tax=Staphylococcus pseudoxylosus TaxID=2282419 RepID=UPI001F18469E|nr:hypothetical protein [Staphylococcus pseudoxylosus]MCE5003448.1 hypothetical protein [Staphylococcus pseudoxylosus]
MIYGLISLIIIGILFYLAPMIYRGMREDVHYIIAIPLLALYLITSFLIGIAIQIGFTMI